MQCLICNREIPLKLGYVSNSQRYCSTCFIHLIERRARKYIKEHHPLKKNQRVVATDSLSSYFLKNIVHVPLTILKKKTKTTDLVLSFATKDDTVVAFLEALFSGKKVKKIEKHFFSFFSSVTDEELALYCQYKHLSFKPRKHPLKKILETIRKQHPETFHSLAKSVEDLENY